VSFTTGRQGDTVIVHVEGQLIVGNRQELKQMVLDQIERGERRFLIDFSQTGYIDSSGLGVLVSLSKKIREQGGELRLGHLNDDLRTLFEMTKLDTLFRLEDGGNGAAGAGVPAPLRSPPRAGGAEEPLRQAEAG
jgi:anti-sigma B factor antagonist